MRILGLSAPLGSWNTIWARRRNSRSAAPSRPPSGRALEEDLAGGRRVQPEQRPGQGGLAAAALAHQAEDLAPADVEAHPVHRPQGRLAAGERAAAVELLDQVADLDQSVHVAPILRQAAVWPGACSTDGGTSRAHSSAASGQRGWKAQPGGHLPRLRHPCRGWPAGACRAAGVGDGLQQEAGVGVQRLAEQPLARGALHDPPGVDHRDAVGDLVHHPQVVGDEQHPQPQPVAQPEDEPQDLALQGDVQRRGGLVGDEQRGIAGDGHGDHHPLLHPAGQLVGVGVEHPAAVRQAHPLHQGARPLQGGGGLQPQVQGQHLGDLLAAPSATG